MNHQEGGTFRARGIGGRPRLVVTADGAGILSHAGTALLGGLADRVGLTGDAGGR